MRGKRKKEGHGAIIEITFTWTLLVVGEAISPSTTGRPKLSRQEAEAWAPVARRGLLLIWRGQAARRSPGPQP